MGEEKVSCVKEKSVLENVISSIQHEASRVRDSKNRLCNLNNKLMGDIPNDPLGKDVPAPCSILDQLNDALDQLRHSNDELNNEFSRIEANII